MSAGLSIQPFGPTVPLIAASAAACSALGRAADPVDWSGTPDDGDIIPPKLDTSKQARHL
jgi:hypothetical protein